MQQHLLQVSNFYNNATQQHLIREENFLLYQKTNLRSLNPTIVNRGNGYETRQSSFLYVIVLFFGLNPAQNTIDVYFEQTN